MIRSALVPEPEANMAIFFIFSCLGKKEVKKTLEVSKVMEKVLLLQKIVVEKRSNLKNNNC